MGSGGRGDAYKVLRVVKWDEFLGAACYCNSLKSNGELDYVVVRPAPEVPELKPESMSEEKFVECHVFFGRKII